VRILTVLGARPQFIKASPLSLALRQQHQEVLVHTGQHYDYGMSDVFFEELGIPPPDYHLGVGSGPHGAQTGAMLEAIEEVLQKERPHLVIVYGDTNSTLAGALAAAKLHIPVAHVEAGLRSFNRAMPEEINRVLTDHLSTWLFVPSAAASDQLAAESLRTGVHIVGDIMYDALLVQRARAESRASLVDQFHLHAKQFYLATIHRPENTDDRNRLAAIFQGFEALDKPVVLPLHPRTSKMLRQFKIQPGQNVKCLEPVGYLDMLKLQCQAACVLTDSGGVQKEAYYLRVPCVTLRRETEWIETVAAGWNVVCGTDPIRIVETVQRMAQCPAAHSDLYGDGTAGQKIVQILEAGRP